MPQVMLVLPSPPKPLAFSKLDTSLPKCKVLKQIQCFSEAKMGMSNMVNGYQTGLESSGLDWLEPWLHHSPAM